MRLSDKESPKLVVDEDEGEENLPSWALVGKILYKKVLHVNTIVDAPRPTWGNPKGPMFNSICGRKRVCGESKTAKG